MGRLGRPRLTLTSRPSIYGPGFFFTIAYIPARVFVSRAARMASKGLRGGLEGSSMEPWERTVDRTVVALTQQRTNNV
jgi:hypothetical protein